MSWEKIEPKKNKIEEFREKMKILQEEFIRVELEKVKRLKNVLENQLRVRDSSTKCSK